MCLAGSDVEIKDVPADKGYHSKETLTWCQSFGIRTYIPERESRWCRRWTDKLEEEKSAVYKVFGTKAAVQRCQWHKRENVVRYLSTSQQATFRRKLQRAYDQPTYSQAKTALKKVRGELNVLNQSAVASLDEGFEETLTLHRLGLFKELGRSFKTTNCIENLNSLIGNRTGKVDRWRNSEQKHRWLATAILDVEPRLRTVVAYRHLPRLRAALQSSSNRSGKAVA